MKFAAPRSSSGPQRPQLPRAARAPGITVLAMRSLPSRDARLEEPLREGRAVDLAALGQGQLLRSDLLEVARHLEAREALPAERGELRVVQRRSRFQHDVRDRYLREPLVR